MSMETPLTLVEGRYLKLIYRRQVEEGRRTKTTSLARIFNVQPATVTEMLQKLGGKGFLWYIPYRGVELTEEGFSRAQGLLRRHRLLETFLVNSLGYGAQEACEEAGRLDHHASKTLIDKICRAYGHPKVCPCEKSIFRSAGCNE